MSGGFIPRPIWRDGLIPLLVERLGDHGPSVDTLETLLSESYAGISRGKGLRMSWELHGFYDDVDVSGRTMVLSLVSPKLMVEGNWRAGLVFDANTSDDQMERLTNVFTGALGGPMAGLAPLIGEFLGAERADIDLESTERRVDVDGRGRHQSWGFGGARPGGGSAGHDDGHHRPPGRTDADDHAVTGGALVVVRNRVLGRLAQRVQRSVQLGRLTR